MRTLARALLCLSLVPAAAVDAAAPSKGNRPTAYPSKPIRIILPLSAGGSADSIARTTADTLAEGFGHPVVVDNRPGTPELEAWMRLRFERKSASERVGFGSPQSQSGETASRGYARPVARLPVKRA